MEADFAAAFPVARVALPEGAATASSSASGSAVASDAVALAVDFLAVAAVGVVFLAAVALLAVVFFTAVVFLAAVLFLALDLPALVVPDDACSTSARSAGSADAVVLFVTAGDTGNLSLLDAVL